jgi:hypothetical protein
MSIPNIERYVVNILKNFKFEVEDASYETQFWFIKTGEGDTITTEMLAFYEIDEKTRKYKIDLSKVTVGKELRGFCTPILILFFIKILQYLISHGKILPEYGEVEILSQNSDAAAMCYLKAFRAVGFQITPESYTRLLEKFRGSYKKTSEKINYTLYFKLHKLPIDYPKLHVFYNQNKGGYVYTWKISEAGIFLYKIGAIKSQSPHKIRI